MRLILICISLLLFILDQSVSSAQNYTIQNIEITGNKKTKPIVIYRELDFKLSDTIDLHELAKRIEINEKRLLSTGLFNLCDINLKNINFDSLTLDVVITVKENWYIYPAPIFELADRSFNVWAKEFDYSFKRLNYGVRLDHTNTFGYKDRLKLKVQFGFTDKYELDYSTPYLFNKWGIRFNTLYSENKEIGYKTQGNRVQFAKLPDEAVMLKRFRIGAAAINRMDVFSTQYIKLEYFNGALDPRVSSTLNPSYYPDKGSKINYMRLVYELDYDKRVFPTYPEGGYSLGIDIEKNGLGFGNYNSTNIIIEAETYSKLSNNWIIGGSLRAGHKFINGEIPYANNEAIGYNVNVIRGYELYVLDGKSFAWYKTGLRYNLLDKKIDMGKYMPIKAFNVLPLKLFLRASFEGGYSYEPTYIQTNSLNNTHIYGGGLGIDILLLNTSLFSIEYNSNKQGERGFFFKGGFKI